jgi:hypothetical protein
MRSVCCTRYIGMQGCPSSFLLMGHPPTKLEPRLQLAQCSEEHSAYPVAWSLGLLPTGSDRTTVNHVANLKDWLHDIHHYKSQHLKSASDRMKVHYDHLAKPTGFQAWPSLATQPKPDGGTVYHDCIVFVSRKAKFLSGF